MFHYTIATERSIDETVKELTELLQEEKFGVLWEFDIKDKLQSKGLDFNQSYKVLEVCNPFEANKVLQENQLVGYFLPCKIVVYDDEGTTKVGLPKPTAMISMLEDEKLKGIAADIEATLMKVLDKLK